jgi:hypothetical protein
MTKLRRPREFQSLGAALLRAPRRTEEPARMRELLDRHERGEL